MKSTLAVAALAVSFSVAAFSQPAPAKLSFDVADIQVSDSVGKTSLDFLPGGRMELRNVTGRTMISVAYKLMENMVEGGPDWFDSDRFDIVAKADPKSTIDTLRLMLQTLLAERFKLTIHWNRKVMPVYTLAPGKGGLKLKASEAGAAAKLDCKREPLPDGTPGVALLTCTHMTMAELAELLPAMAPAYFDSPVVDLTGLKGAFDVKLSWTGRGYLEGEKKDEDGNPIPAAGGLSVFDAVQAQLGLKLESKKYPMQVIVVDHVERKPTAN